jgi:hypothetical protein
MLVESLWIDASACASWISITSGGGSLSVWQAANPIIRKKRLKTMRPTLEIFVFRII